MVNQRRVHTEQVEGRLNQGRHEDEYDLDQLPDDQYEFDQQEGQQAAPAGDDENIDFTNYKGIYADDDAGQKYQCPETGAHFEPKDLCKRIYKIVQKLKPHEMELYGQPMLLDGVGSSLIANAPYGNGIKPQTAVEKSKGQPPNARAGSMKQQVVQGYGNAINEAYDSKGPSKGGVLNMSNINKNKQISNVEQCMSSSLLSEKLDKKHMVNFSSGNQKNIKFKNKFGEQQNIQTNSSKSPTKRLNTQQATQPQAKVLQINQMPQNSRNNGNGLPNQSLSMHVLNNYNQKTLNNGAQNQKSLSIGGVDPGKQTITNNGAPQRVNTVYNQQQQNQAKDKRAQSLGQGKPDKPKDAFSIIQEQQRAEQAKQPQNQFEHQENILKQLNSDEVYDKLMKIFNDREKLYDQLEKENKDNKRSSMNPKQQPKNSSAEPVIRGHQSQQSNILSSGPNVKASPYQAGVNMGMQQQQQQQIIPLKASGVYQQNTSQFHQYVNQNQQSQQNSRNQVLKSGIGGRLNTKNNNAFLSGGVPANRQNTQASFQGQSPQKYGNGSGPSGPQTAGPSTQARGGASASGVGSKQSTILNHQASSGKIQKKKAVNLSGSTNNKILHQSQISLNNMSMGLNSHHSTFYGNQNQHQQVPQKQLSKNEIISKYMKSQNSNTGIQSQSTLSQQQRQPSNQGIISQYNNFMRSVAQNQSNKNPAMNGAHSRNQNQFGISSKTHTESMIYNGNGGSMGGSFSQGMQQKKVPAQGSRPMSSYNKPTGTSKKKQNVTMGSDQSFRQEQYQAHVINQSLKPKMINNQQMTIQNSSTTRPGAMLHQHLGNNGDVQVQNISISNNRPQSSKITKKKTTNNVMSVGGSYNQNIMAQQQQYAHQQQYQAKYMYDNN